MQLDLQQLWQKSYGMISQESVAKFEQSAMIQLPKPFPGLKEL